MPLVGVFTYYVQEKKLFLTSLVVALALGFTWKK